MALSYFLSDVFTYNGVTVADNVLARVFFAGTTALAPLYHDALGARKPNPLRTDPFGQIEFYAEDGSYDILINGLTFTVNVAGGTPQAGAASTSLVVSAGTPGGPAVGKGRVYNDLGRVLVVTSIRVTALNVSGGGLLVDVNKNGSTIYTTQANRPAVPAGAGTGTVKNAGFNPGTKLEDGAYVSVDVDQGTFDHLIVQIFVR